MSRQGLKSGRPSAVERFGMEPMALQSELSKTREIESMERAGEMRYVARQPILDGQGRLHGYELLFRKSPEAISHGEGELATRTLLDDTVIFGLERFTNGLPAFVHCTAEALTEELVHVLPPSMTVLVIPSSLDPTTRLIDACRKLKASGFRIALEDFSWNPDLQQLVEMADYVRLNFNMLGELERRHLQMRLNRVPVALVAKAVQTGQDHRQACLEGFTLFQGDYFCRPVLLKNRKVPANRLVHFEILRHLHHDPIHLRKLSLLVMRDAGLTYRLLRLVNSPFYAIRKEVRSIESAIVIVGESTFRRIATDAILSELNSERPPEILNMAHVRGRFCELAAAHCSLAPAEQYLLGMFSLLPAMLRTPMEELAPSLPLRDEIRAALLGAANRERSLLVWLEAHERGEWDACDAIVDDNLLSREHLMIAYAEAVIWAADALRSVA
jgi:EAL and modified HD-GYP domain-containing signal transduction protein